MRTALSFSPADGTSEFVEFLTELANAQGSAFYEPRHGHQTLVRRAAGGSLPPEPQELRYEELDHLKRRKEWATLPLDRKSVV